MDLMLKLPKTGDGDSLNEEDRGGQWGRRTEEDSGAWWRNGAEKAKQVKTRV